MADLIRWIHPDQVDEQYRPAPNAFPLAEIKHSCKGKRKKCCKEAMSLADMSLMTPANRDSAFEAVCRLCRGLHIHSRIRKRWDHPASCPCGYNSSGIKGAGREEFRANQLTVQNAASRTNPLHVLLCLDRDLPDQMEALEIQFKLTEVFASVKDLSELFPV